MNTIRISASRLCIAAIALCSAHVSPAQEGLGRNEVLAELREARLAGAVSDGGEIGLPLREISPWRYPASPMAPVRSRSDVEHELFEARRSGDQFAGGESGMTLSELNPWAYPRRAPVEPRSRAAVLAELALARERGELTIGEDGLTPAQRLPRVDFGTRARPVLHAAW